MAETRVLNGSEILIECLKEQGVKTVFGYPGGAILNIYDALYKHQDEITHILTPMSRAHPMLRTVMRGLRERLVYAWLLPARVLPTW